MNLIPASVLLEVLKTNFIAYILPIILSYSEVGKNILFNIFDVIMQQDIIVQASCGMLVSILAGVLFMNLISLVLLWIPTLSILSLAFGTYAQVTRDYYLAVSFIIPSLTFLTVYILDFLWLLKHKKPEDLTLKWMKKNYPNLYKKEYVKVLVIRLNLVEQELKEKKEKIEILEREIEHLYKIQKTN